MKKGRAGIFCLAAAAMITFLSGCTSSGSSGDKIKLKIATVGNESHQSTIAASVFKEKLEELAGNRFEITVYPNAQLGGEREMAEGVKIGSIEMAVVTTDGALPSFVPETQVLAIPYLFADKEEAYSVLDGYLQETLKPEFEEQGFKHLAFCELGFRHFTNNVKEITKAEDMKGLSIRVQESPIWFALADHLDFIATPISFNELYTALQQGTVDGQENPIASISSSAFDEVQKYMCLDGHTYAPESMIMNLDFYNRLTDEERAWIDEASVYARDTQRQMVTDMEEEMLKAIEDKGVDVCREPDLESFRKATETLYQDSAVTALVSPELTEGVKAAVAQYEAEHGERGERDMIDKLVDGLARMIMGVSALLVFAITFLQVLCRFVLKSPLPWSTDILRLVFTYLVFWGAAWCVREKEHLNVDVVLTALPAGIRRWTEILINLILCVFFIFLIYFGIQFCIFGWTQTTSYLPLPMTVYYASIPSAGAAMLYYMVKILIRQIRNNGEGEV